MGRPDYILGQFGETARCGTRERGLLCFSTTACSFFKFLLVSFFPSLSTAVGRVEIFKSRIALAAPCQDCGSDTSHSRHRSYRQHVRLPVGERWGRPEHLLMGTRQVHTGKAPTSDTDPPESPTAPARPPGRSAIITVKDRFGCCRAAMLM